MNPYTRWVFPFLVDWALRNQDAAACRKRLLPLAEGRVLEVGIGSGLNLPYYGPGVRLLIGIDPSAELLAKARRRLPSLSCAVNLVQASVQAVPLPSDSVDVAVMTWTLCSVPDPGRALRELRRVLRPAGRLLFIEHGLAPEAGVRRWQRRLNPVWTRISCHLDRPVDRLLDEAGFEIATIERAYVGTGPRVLSFMYQGWARPR